MGSFLPNEINGRRTYGAETHDLCHDAVRAVACPCGHFLDLLRGPVRARQVAVELSALFGRQIGVVQNIGLTGLQGERRFR